MIRRICYLSTSLLCAGFLLNSSPAQAQLSCAVCAENVCNISPIIAKECAKNCGKNPVQACRVSYQKSIQEQIRKKRAEERARKQAEEEAARNEKSHLESLFDESNKSGSQPPAGNVETPDQAQQEPSSIELPQVTEVPPTKSHIPSQQKSKDIEARIDQAIKILQDIKAGTTVNDSRTGAISQDGGSIPIPPPLPPTGMKHHAIKATTHAPRSTLTAKMLENRKSNVRKVKPNERLSAQDSRIPTKKQLKDQKKNLRKVTQNTPQKTEVNEDSFSQQLRKQRSKLKPIKQHKIESSEPFPSSDSENLPTGSSEPETTFHNSEPENSPLDKLGSALTGKIMKNFVGG